MIRFRDYLLSTAAIAGVMVACGVAGAHADDDGHSRGHGYKHVLLISVDGMHSVDLKRWVENHPGGNFAKLADNGVVYPNAYTTAPSDSYPGMLAQVTGATPKSGGLFYDDSYDRTVYPAKAFYTSQGLPDPGCGGRRKRAHQLRGARQKLQLRHSAGDRLHRRRHARSGLHPARSGPHAAQAGQWPVRPGLSPRIRAYQYDLRSDQGGWNAHGLVR